MISRIIFLIVFATLSFSAYAQDGEYYKINGAQVFVLSDIYKDDVALFFAEAKRRGVNTVFFRVFHNTVDRTHLGLPNSCQNGGVYFKSDEACMVADILPEVIAAAHAHDIKLYAWMATRSLSFLKTDAQMSKAYMPDGTIGVGYGANLFNPQVRQSIMALFEDLAKYDIDGILMQDDFIIKYNEGADVYAKRHYELQLGKEVDVSKFFEGTKEYNGKLVFTGYTDYFYEWAAFKLQYMARFLKDINEKTKAINSDIKIAANVYYETPIDPKNALAWYSQSVEGLLWAGADYLAVMGYVEQIAAEKNISELEASKLLNDIASNAVAKTGDAKRVILKVQSKYFYGSKQMLLPYLFASACNYNRDIRDLSYAVVPIDTAYDINNACFR